MKGLFAALALSVLVLGRCTPVTLPRAEESSSETAASEESAYVPLNYENPKGMWLPYLDYEEYMQGKTPEEFRMAVRERFENASADGINTVYLHVRPNGDAYYKSELFPSGAYLSGDYDPLEIMLDEAHSLGLSAHAWINPLRLQTAEQMQEIPESYITKQWYTSGKSANIGEANGRLWLKPSSAEVLELLKRNVSEIVGNYDVDGIHIDDYFYPTADESFDAEEFNGTDLAEWRRNAVSEMVKTMYSAVKETDSRVLFGISPQGNLDADYNTQYADIERWFREKGFADYIIPQIYYGFNNETLPFLPTLAEWEKLAEGSGKKLIIGLGAYKLGKDDEWAGESGETEWLENPDIIERQITAVEDSSADGYSLYY